MFNNDENQRFNFEVEISPKGKGKGDFGCVRIGGMYRSIEQCIQEAKEMEEQISRHVDGVESFSFKIVDAFGEYKDISEWQYKQLVTKIAKEKECSIWQLKWEDIEPHLPKHKGLSEEEKVYEAMRLLKNLLDNSSFATQFPSEHEDIELFFEELEGEE